MSEISAKLVSELREKTGLGMMDCKKALVESQGDIEAAITALRKKGELKAGAKALIDETAFSRAKPGSPYCAPQVLVGVDHSMRVMSEESFGPLIGLMKVTSDEEAIRLMNDSQYGLTAAIWTMDEDAAIRIGHAIETGFGYGTWLHGEAVALGMVMACHPLWVRFFSLRCFNNKGV